MHKEKTEATYIAWDIFEEMLRGMTEDQLLVLDRLVRAERRERWRRPDLRQRWLWSAQAAQEVRR